MQDRSRALEPTARPGLVAAACLFVAACGGGAEDADGAATATAPSSDDAPDRVALEGGEVPAAASGERPSVLVITIDTIRADHLGFHGYPRETSTYLDTLAESSVVFDRAYAPIATTLPSHTTMFTGVQPHEHGVLANIADGKVYTRREDLRMLAELFTDAGYATTAIVSALPLRAETGIDAGFESYRMPKRRTRVAQETTDEALAALREQAAGDAPGFVWVHYFDPHGPYNPPVPYGKRFQMDQEHREFIGRRRASARAKRPTGQWNYLDAGIDGYDGEIAYLDEHVNRLVVDAESMGWLDDTSIVAVLGDHGEGLNQHGIAGHGVVWEEQLHVPFLIRAPGAAPRRIATPVTLADFVPTLLHLVDLPGEDAFLAQASGVNRFAPTAEHADLRVVAQTSPRQSASEGIGYSLLAGRWKLHRRVNGSTALYDLDVDPYELIDVAPRQPKVVESLSGELDAILAAQRGEVRTEEASDEVKKDLGALGYGGDDEDG